MDAILLKANDKKHKYIIVINGKKIKFGSYGSEDYTIHNDETKKLNYIKRHIKRENWNDYYSKGFWSRWLLWHKKTLNESIKSINKLFNIKIYH